MNSQVRASVRRKTTSDILSDVERTDIVATSGQKSGLRRFYERAATIPRLTSDDEYELSASIHRTKNQIISILSEIQALYMQYFESESRVEAEHRMLTSPELTDVERASTTECDDQHIHNISSILVALDCLSDMATEVRKHLDVIASEVFCHSDSNALAEFSSLIRPGMKEDVITRYITIGTDGRLYSSICILLRIAEQFQCGIDKILTTNTRCQRLLNDYYGFINRLVAPNLRLSIVLAKQWYIQSVPFDDLVQEGNLGLMKAADRYKAILGVNFSVYARWWIKAYVFAANRQLQRLIHAPKNRERAYREMLRVKFDLESSLGRAPTSTELSSRMSCSIDDIREITKFERTTTIDNSLCMYDKETDIDEYGTCIDACTYTLYSSIDRQTVRQKLNTLISKMPELHQDFMRLRWGLSDDIEPLSIKAAADRLGISISRARAIDTASLTHIRQCVADLPEVDKEGLYMHINDID